MTSPSLSWVLVALPRVAVPRYSFSSLMRRSWIRVALPTTRMSIPVAIGSSVPQCPIFLVQAATGNGDHIMRGHAGGFVYQEDSVN